MCLMHDAEGEYGVLRWPLAEIALAVNCKLADLAALRRKGVLKGADDGEACEAFVYVPRSGGRDGDPVTLVTEQPGPVWYSSRMVRDEYVRIRRGEGSRFASDDAAPPNDALKSTPKPPFGIDKGHGSSSSSSVKEKKEGVRKRSTPARASQIPDAFPSDVEFAWCREHRPELDPPRVGQVFRDFHLAKGSAMKDWPAAWRTWVGKERGLFAIKSGGVAETSKRANEWAGVV